MARREKVIHSEVTRLMREYRGVGSLAEHIAVHCTKLPPVVEHFCA